MKWLVALFSFSTSDNVACLAPSHIIWTKIVLVESKKTTSTEDVSTGVLEKKKYLRSNDKAKKWYDVSRHIWLHMSKYKKKMIYYPACQTYSPTGV